MDAPPRAVQGHSSKVSSYSCSDLHALNIFHPLGVDSSRKVEELDASDHCVLGFL